MAGPTSLGVAGTTKTLLSGGNLVLPGWARSIVAVIPQATIDVPTVQESVHSKLILESDDFRVGPFEVPCAPLSACLGATVGPSVSKPERYLVNCPVNGGDQLKVYGQSLIANTAAAYMACSVVVSDQPPLGPQRFAKMGTLTSTGTTASTDVSGTQYSFSNCARIVELLGVVAPQALAAADAMIGYIRFNSSEFQFPTPLKLPFNPVPGGLSTIFSTKIDGVSRAPVSVPTNPGQVNIQDYLNMGLAPAGAGYFVSGVIFE